MLPQTQIAGHLVIERATLPPPPYGGKIKSKTLCQATVLATQIWLKLDSENLNRSLLCTFGWSETQILSGRREPAIWLWRGPGVLRRTSAVTDVGLQCFTVFRQSFHCWWWEFSDCDKRAARSDTLQCWLRHTKKIWWHWFAMAVIYVAVKEICNSDKEPVRLVERLWFCLHLSRWHWEASECDNYHHRKISTNVSCRVSLIAHFLDLPNNVCLSQWVRTNIRYFTQFAFIACPFGTKKLFESYS